VTVLARKLTTDDGEVSDARAESANALLFVSYAPEKQDVQWNLVSASVRARSNISLRLCPHSARMKEQTGPA
jgi:hypothetical protein